MTYSNNRNKITMNINLIFTMNNKNEGSTARLHTYTKYNALFRCVMKRKKKYSMHLQPPKIIHGRKPRKQKKKHVFKVRTLILLLIASLLIYQFNRISALPSALEASRIKVNNITTQIVTKALADTLTEQKIMANEMTNYYVDEAGELVYCGINTILVNKISNGVSERINQEITEMKIEYIYIPLGKLLSDGLFSNYGPKLKVSIKPCGVVGIDYDHSFTAVGINQVNYRVWLRVNMEMQVYLISNLETIQVTQDIILIDQVINGKVPDSYVNVPDQDSMLNVIQ